MRFGGASEIFMAMIFICSQSPPDAFEGEIASLPGAVCIVLSGEKRIFLQMGTQNINNQNWKLIRM